MLLLKLVVIILLLQSGKLSFIRGYSMLESTTTEPPFEFPPLSLSDNAAVRAEVSNSLINTMLNLSFTN